MYCAFHVTLWIVHVDLLTPYVRQWRVVGGACFDLKLESDRDIGGSYEEIADRKSDDPQWFARLWSSADVID